MRVLVPEDAEAFSVVPLLTGQDEEIAVPVEVAQLETTSTAPSPSTSQKTASSTEGVLPTVAAGHFPFALSCPG